MPSTATDTSRDFVVPNPSPRAARLDQLGAAGRLALYRAGEFARADLVTWAVYAGLDEMQHFTIKTKK